MPRKANFISKLVTDPKNPPNTLLLKGYLGDSSDEGHTRLYFDAQLSNYVEIPNDAILHEEEVAPQNSPAGESFIWIKPDADVIYGQAGPRAKGKFFEGAIAQAAAAPIPTLEPPSCRTRSDAEKDASHRGRLSRR